MQLEDFKYNEATGVFTDILGRNFNYSISKAKDVARKEILIYITDQISQILELNQEHERKREFEWVVIRILNTEYPDYIKTINEMVFEYLKYYCPILNENRDRFISIMEPLRVLTNEFTKRHQEPLKIIKKSQKMEMQLDLFN